MDEVRSRIRFTCAHCTTTMEVRRRFAGRKVRCPYCQMMLDVPQESQPRKKEGYAVRKGAPDSPAEAAQAAEPLLAVTCPVCATRMYATRKQVGEQLICPDCGTSATVPRPVKKAVSLDPPPAPKEEYKVYGPDQPPPTVKEVHQRYLPVVCSLCRTRLLATEDQVGQKLICPDCFTENVVREPEEVPTLEMPTAEERGEYALRDRAGPTPAEAPDPQELFLVKCPVCLTRLHARAGQAGEPMKCPDCKRSFTIPKPPPKTRKTAGDQDEPIETYTVGAAVQRTAAIVADGGLRPGTGPSTDGGQEGAEHDAEGPSRGPGRLVVSSPRPVLPAWPLVNGVLNYPLTSGAMKAWLIFLATTVFLGLSWIYVIELAFAGGPSMILGLLGMAVLLVATAIWLIWVFLGLLSIVTETAAGADVVEEWGADMYDRLFDALYIFNSLVLSGAVGLAISRFATEALRQVLPDAAVQEPGLLGGLCLLAGMWLLFPILLLSFLETGSFINPVSWPVWRSLVTALPGWLGFYLLSGILGVGAVVLDVLLVGVGGRVGLVGSAAVLTAAVLIYFRMLGRLGWYCMDRLARPKPSEGAKTPEPSEPTRRELRTRRH